MKIKWTKEMDKILKTYAGNMNLSRKELSKVLKVSEGAIRNREKDLGLMWVSMNLCGENNPMYGRSRPDFKNNHWSKLGYRQNGDKNPNWKGGKYTSGGYRYIKVGEKKYQLEHRKIMEKHLNRKLNKGEVVHHINGDTLDNRIENLQLCSSQSEHLCIHWHNGGLRKNI